MAIANHAAAPTADAADEDESDRAGDGGATISKSRFAAAA